MKMEALVKRKEIQKITAEMSEAMTELDEAVAQYNAQAERLFERILKPKEDKVNTVVARAQEFVEVTAGRAEDEFDAAPPAWRDSKYGEKHLEWVHALNNAADQLGEVHLAKPIYERADVPKRFIQTLAQLPASP